MFEFKSKPNFIPTDLNLKEADSQFGFNPEKTPGVISKYFPTFKGKLADKNFADLSQNDDIRNKDATYIIGGRLFDAVVDVNGRGDFLTIQDALTAGKTRIFLRKGTYKIYSVINITSSSIVIRGESPNNTIVQMQTNNTDCFSIASDVASCLFADFLVESVSGGTTGRGFVFGSTTDHNVIYNCNIRSMESHGIYVANSGQISVLNSLINTNGEDGIQIATSGNMVISGCEIFNNEKHGINFVGCNYSNIVNNRLTNNGKATNNTYSHILLDDDGAGSNSTYNVIMGNIFTSTVANKVKYSIREDNASQDYNLILGNIMSGAVTANISTQGANTILGDNIA